MLTKRRLAKYALLLIVGTYVFVLALTEVFIKQRSDQSPNHEGVGKGKESARDDSMSQRRLIPTKAANHFPPGPGVKTKEKSVENSKNQLARLKEMNDELLKQFLEEFPEMRDVYSPSKASAQDRLTPECGLGGSSRRDRSSPAAANLPLAPPVFYPLSTGQKQNKGMPGMDLNALGQGHSCKPTEKRWANQCCRTVYFLGGGKCGSTSLALLLKHNMSSLDHFDPTSGFADGGKEPCWALTAGNERDFYSKFKQCQQPRYMCGSSNEVGLNQPHNLMRPYQSRHEMSSKTVVLDGCPRYSKVNRNKRL
ncbi:uncharacterized protein LOC142335029 [Convolutriloba macropyga]|uniref:uncharacterized protein LOC142335029 n=1 Tax=Convolutriloba macropyga TaxID=536237 RepID=UPI003F51D0B5